MNMDEYTAENPNRRGAPFVFSTNGGVYVRYNLDDIRTPNDWIEQDIHEYPDTIPTLIRGYIYPSVIQFYQGKNFEAVDMKRVSVPQLMELIKARNSIFGEGHLAVCNGVKQGKLGDLWRPVQILFTTEA